MVVSFCIFAEVEIKLVQGTNFQGGCLFFSSGGTFQVVQGTNLPTDSGIFTQLINAFYNLLNFKQFQAMFT